jgi:hypothetical protein
MEENQPPQTIREAGETLAHRLGHLPRAVDLVPRDRADPQADRTLALPEDVLVVVRVDHRVDDPDLVAVPHQRDREREERERLPLFRRGVARVLQRHEQDDASLLRSGILTLVLHRRNDLLTKKRG